MKKPFTPEEFKAIYSKVPRLSVDVVIPYDNGIALIERAHETYKGQWHLPGGTVYLHETLEDAAKRLAKEETGWDIAVGEMLGYIEYHSELAERGYGYPVAMVFACTIVGGNLQLDEGGSDLQSFSSIPANTIIDQKEFLETLDLSRIIAKDEVLNLMDSPGVMFPSAA